MSNIILTTVLTASLLLSQPGEATPVAGQTGQLVVSQAVLASESLNLNERYPVSSVSDGFKENILLAVSFLEKANGGVLILQPAEVFAFHKNILPQFQDEKIITQESGFGVKDGYKVIAGLPGNGVCHLASLMNKAAQEAGLSVTAEVNHNFAAIPGIEREYGTSIYFMPGGGNNSAAQNLYIQNNKDYAVEFKFSLEGEQLIFQIVASK